MSEENALRVHLEVAGFEEFAAKMARAERIAFETNKAINGFGKNASFGKDISAQFQLAEERAKKFNTSLNLIGKNSTFGKDISAQIETASKKMQNFESQLDRTQRKSANGFGNNVGQGVAQGFGIPLGTTAVAAAGIGFAVKGFSDAAEAAFDSERAYRKLSSAATEAGLSVSVLSDKNRDFAKSAGLSETAAANVQAKIAQLATFSGQPQNIDKLNQSFLDLSAAKGINSKDIDVLIGTILSGQDEGLNRLGISDPGQLQKVYAKELGKSTEALTQQEKVQAAVNAVMDKAAIFTGANADKMQSLSGQAEAASAKLDNLYTNFGKGLTGSLEFRNALTLANDLLNAMTTNIDDVQSKLAKGISPKRLAQEEANRPINQVKDAVADFVSPVGATIGLFLDSYKDTDEKSRNFFASLGGSRQRRFEDNLKLFTVEGNKLQTQTKDALNEHNKQVQTNFAGAGKEAQKLADTINKFKLSGVDSYLEYGKAEIDSGTGTNLEKIREISELEQNAIKEKIRLQKQYISEQAQNLSPEDLNGAKGTQFALESVETINKLQYQGEIARLNAEKQITGEIEKSNQKIKEIEKSSTELLDNLYRKNGADNPFAQVFFDADKAIKTVRDSVKGLSEEMQSAFVAMQDKLNANALFEARIDNNLAAFDLRERAKELRNPFTEQLRKFNENPSKSINDLIEFYTKKLETDLEKSGGALKYYRTADGGSTQVTENPYTKYNSNIFADGKNPDGTPKLFTGGFTQTDLRDEFSIVFERTGGFIESSGGKGFENSVGGFFRRQKTFADLTESEKSQYFGDLQSQKDNESLNDRLQKQLSIIHSGGAFTPEQQAIADKKLVALTSGLRPEEIDRKTREDVALANEREAARKGDGEAKAAEQRQAELEYSKSISENIAALKKLAEDGKIKFDLEGVPILELTVQKGLSVDTQKKPPRTPNASDVARGMGLENYR